MGLFNRTNRKNYVATPSAESDPDLTPHSRTVSSTSRDTNDTDVPSMWARVRSGPPGAVLARPVVWSLDDVCFTVTEMIRNTLPDSRTLPPGVDKYMVAEQWAQALETVRDAGFEHTWRDDQDRRIDPPWITLRSAVFDLSTGRIAASGHFTHRNWEASPAYDLGAITGSNGMSWAAAGHADGLPYPTSCLYIGDLFSGALAPVDARAPVCSVDLDPTTGTVAVLESLGMVGCLAVYRADGERRRLTVIDEFSGGEPVRFSPDGRWLLVSRYDGSLLCEVATGRHIRGIVANCGWWPLADSTLLALACTDGRVVPRLFDLEGNRYVHDFPEIVLDEPWLPGLAQAWNPSVSPDGTELLFCTPAGVGVEHRQQHGVGQHLAKVSLSDGRGRLQQPALLDEVHPWERDVGEARWSGPRPLRSTRLHPDLEAQLHDPILDHEDLDPTRYAPEAEEFLVKTLNHAIDLTQNRAPMAHLIPEALVSLAALAGDPDRWSNQRNWLTGLASATSTLIDNGQMSGPAASAWRHFGTAVDQLVNGRPELIDPVGAIWV